MVLYLLLQGNLAQTSSTLDWGILQAKALALLSAMQYNVEKLSSVGLQECIEKAVTSYVMSDRVRTEWTLIDAP